MTARPLIQIHDASTGEDTIRPMTDEEYSSWQASQVPQVPQVPASVEMRQARIALYEAGILSQVPTAIAAITDPDKKAIAEIEWEFSPTVKRASPWVIDLGASLGLTSSQIDDLFILAATK